MPYAFLRRVTPILLLPLLAVACAPVATPPPVTETALPNFVLVVIDTLRADRVLAQRDGKPVMPFLAQLSREGVYYRNAISPCSWTKPAMASLFTGVYPPEHGVRHSARGEDPEHPISDKLPDRWVTMAERFAALGCATQGIQTNANLTRALGFAQGFPEGHYDFYNGGEAAGITSAALARLAGLSAPYFLYVHYMDPHVPYTPNPEVEGAFGPPPDLPDYDRALIADNDRFLAYYLDQALTEIGLQPAHTVQDLSPEGREAVLQRYDLECLAADRGVERLLTEIREQFPDTIFVILADHGEEFWERGGMGHGTTLFREQVHVPLIIVDPKTPPAIHDELVSTLDLSRLLPARLGLGGNQATDVSGSQPVLSYTEGPWPFLEINQRAVFDARYIFVQDLARSTETLYDWQADPGEKVNLAAQLPDITGQLRTTLVTASDRPAPPSETVELSDDAVSDLDSYGYLGGKKRNPR